jgi:hypothetical protein
MAALEFTIPGTLGPHFEVRRTRLGMPQLYANGERLKSRRFRATYDVRASDGKLHEVRFNQGYTALKVRIDGTWQQLEPPLPRWAVILVFLPLGVMAYLGGLLGVLFGVGAAAANRRIARSERGVPIRAVGMLGTGAIAVLLYLAGSFGIAVALEFALWSPTERVIGTCYTGLEPGSGTNHDEVPVDCLEPHDAEVMANVEHPSGDYPGTEALRAFASDECLARFEAYVGLPYEDSAMGVFTMRPQRPGWYKGDQSIICFVNDFEGKMLTGSAKDSRR